MDFDNMYQEINSSVENHANKVLAPSLKKYELFSVLSSVASLLTLPSCQANCARLEILAFVALINCKGTTTLTRQTLEHWLNSQLGTPHVAHIEDPAEDVFVTNVLSNGGEYLILPGLWCGVDSALNLLFMAIEDHGGESQKQWLEPSKALLKLSTELANRLNLPRWTFEESIPSRSIKVPRGQEAFNRSEAMYFNIDNLNNLGISAELLDQFCLTQEDIHVLVAQGMGKSLFFEKPLIKSSSGRYLIYLPTCMGYAAKRNILKNANIDGQLESLNHLTFMISSGQVLDAIDRISNKHGITPINIPTTINNNPVAKSYVFESGKGHFLNLLFVCCEPHLLLHNDHYEAIENSEQENAIINEAINTTQDYIEANFITESCHLFIFCSHLGGLYVIEGSFKRKNWTYDVVSCDEFLTILNDKSYPIEQLVIMLNQRTNLENSKLRLRETGGFLNSYACWRLNDNHFLEARIPHNKQINIIMGLDYQAQFRKKIRSSMDLHKQKTIRGDYSTFLKLKYDSLFLSERELPIYASLDYTQQKALLSYFTHNGTKFWMLATSKSPTYNRVIYELWSGIQILLYRYIKQYLLNTKFDQADIEFYLDFQFERELDQVDLTKRDFNFVVNKHSDCSSYKIIIDEDILGSFYGEANDGERKIFTQIIKILVSLNPHIDRSFVLSQIPSFLSIAAKIVHIHNSDSPVEWLLSQYSGRTYSMPKESMEYEKAKFFQWIEAKQEPYSPDKEQSQRLLNQAVEINIEALISELHIYDRKALITMLLRFNESLHHSRAKWVGSAQAVSALYTTEDAVEAAHQAEVERAQAGSCIRALIEVALCECPLNEGLVPDGYILDSLVAKIAAIIEAGGTSDAIHFGLMESGLLILPNGSFTIDNPDFHNLIWQFMQESFHLGFTKAASVYGFSNDRLEQSPNTKPVVDLDFDNALKAEYGIDYDSLIWVISVLIDMALEKEECIFSVSETQLVKKCEEKGVSEEKVLNFLDSFSLKTREAWLPTSGVKPRDIQPWRYGRRLSLTNKPIILFTEPTDRTYLISLGQFVESIQHILGSIKEARHDKDLFNSKEMRSFIGRQTDELGHEFNHIVKGKFVELGFMAEHEIKLNRLGAPKIPDLGDIDVFAASHDGHIFVVECKRLRPARTNAEMAHTCSSFRGYAGDRLAKHLRRVRWIEDNPDAVRDFFKLTKSADLKIHSILLCNLPVPFKYLKDLPISEEQVVIFSNMDQCLKAFL